MADNPQVAEAAQTAAQAMGGMMQGESPPIPDDPHVTDQREDIASIFGLGEELGPTPNSSETQPDGGASPSGASPAAEGGGEQATPNTPPTPAAPQTGQQGEQPQAPAQPQQAPAAPSAEPAASQSPAPDPAVQALTAQVQALIAQNAELQQLLTQGAGQAPQAGPGVQPDQQQQADPYMDYRLAIPDDVASAVFNEDVSVARQGMQHLINSMGRIIHERVLRSVTERVLPTHLQQFQGNLTQQQTQERMREEYYRDFPQHNDIGIKLIVGQEAQAMWTANPTLVWDANTRAALGARVNARLGVGQPPAQQGTQQQIPSPPAPAPRPAAQMGASTRPAQQDTEGTDEITAVLSA